MFRSLHMKLVLIMLLLITSLMTIVGAFLMTSITGFFIDDFYQQVDAISAPTTPPLSTISALWRPRRTALQIFRMQLRPMQRL